MPHATLFSHQFPDTPSSVLSVFDFDAEEIARQMTIIDFSLFAMIKPSELLNQVHMYVGNEWPITNSTGVTHY